VTIDTSAVVAIMLEEAEIDEFSALIAQATRKLMSTVSILEASMVLESHFWPGGHFQTGFLSAPCFD